MEIEKAGVFHRPKASLAGFVEGGADLFYVRAVGADGFVEFVAGDAEFVGPVGDVGGQLWVDFLGVVWAFGLLFVDGVRFVGLGGVVVLGHCVSSRDSLVR